MNEHHMKMKYVLSGPVGIRTRVRGSGGLCDIQATLQVHDPKSIMLSFFKKILENKKGTWVYKR